MRKDQPVAVITGAASGIGLALSLTCLERGMHVVMADNSPELQEAVHKINQKTLAQGIALSVRCDVRSYEEVESLAKETFRQFNRVDWLFNNAGIIGSLAPIWELSSQEVRHVLDVNLFGVLHGLQAFLPYMFEQEQRSHVINMASVYGLCSSSQLAPYAMSKQAIVALSESLYFDLKRLEKSIDVSVVCPSFTNTALLKKSLGNSNALHHLVAEVLDRSRPAKELAYEIIKAVEKKVFYILPDKEVKEYCSKRTQSIIEQQMPHRHSLEKILTVLSKRVLVE